jgi:hypothetical protein
MAKKGKGGKGKTKIVSTYKTEAGKKHNKHWVKRTTRKTHMKHKGYPMKHIVKKQLTYKKGHKK